MVYFCGKYFSRLRLTRGRTKIVPIIFIAPTDMQIETALMKNTRGNITTYTTISTYDNTQVKFDIYSTIHINKYIYFRTVHLLKIVLGKSTQGQSLRIFRTIVCTPKLRLRSTKTGRKFRPGFARYIFRPKI
jgi:hypothetical protein